MMNSISHEPYESEGLSLELKLSMVGFNLSLAKPETENTHKIENRRDMEINHVFTTAQ